MRKKKKFIKIAIDPLLLLEQNLKSISKHYNLLYLDTGKIYRLIAFIKLNQKNKFNKNFKKENTKFRFKKP